MILEHQYTKQWCISLLRHWDKEESISRIAEGIHIHVCVCVCVSRIEPSPLCLLEFDRAIWCNNYTRNVMSNQETLIIEGVARGAAFSWGCLVLVIIDQATRSTHIQAHYHIWTQSSTSDFQWSIISKHIVMDLWN